VYATLASMSFGCVRRLMKRQNLAQLSGGSPLPVVEHTSTTCCGVAEGFSSSDWDTRNGT
jgi:hypothetical protein